MKRKLAVTDLRLGMYVEELDRPWVGTPFMFQGFEITSDELLSRVQQYCDYVYVMPDRDRSAVYARKGGNNPIIVPGEISTQQQAGASRDVSRVLVEPPDTKRYQNQTSVEQELQQAREVENRTRVAVYTILDDVRLGRSIPTTEAKKVVADIVESVVRNPDAMVVLTQLKNADEYTALHSLRVSILAITFGRFLGLSTEELNLLGVGALLHDVGKMKVPLEILNKPGKLTDAEFEIMKSHVPEGVKVIESARGIDNASLEVVRCHHERYDGSGYANGLPGDRIHAFGQIGAIVDCYDAITSDRCYRKGISPLDALSKMYEWRTRDFHPNLIEQFIQCMGIYPIGSVVEMNDGSIGVVTTVNHERRLLPKVVLVRDRQLNPLVPARIVDLHYENDQGTKLKLVIRKVLPAGTHDVWPVDHLPIRV